ncbi:MAG: hypothetical protein QM736_21405 [Vicinamibacterales bacterium]
MKDHVIHGDPGTPWSIALNAAYALLYVAALVAAAAAVFSRRDFK